MASAHVIFKSKSDKDVSQSGRKVVPHDSKSDLLLAPYNHVYIYDLLKCNFLVIIFSQREI